MLIIDTHILVWFVSGDNQLSTVAKEAIESTLGSGSEVIVSAISTWEIAMLIEKGRLVLSMDIERWINEVEQIEGVRFAVVDNEIGIKATNLPGSFHKDLADRIIVATARKLAIPLVTADQKIMEYQHVKTIW